MSLLLSGTKNAINKPRANHTETKTTLIIKGVVGAAAAAADSGTLLICNVAIAWHFIYLFTGLYFALDNFYGFNLTHVLHAKMMFKRTKQCIILKR